MKTLQLRVLSALLGLVVILSSCTASVGGSSVVPILGANCKNVSIQEENCTIGFGSDNGKLEPSTDTVNLTLGDTADGTAVNINLRNNSTTVDYAVAIVVGPASCTTALFWGPNETGDATVATAAGDGCTIIFTDSVGAERILQTSLGFTIAQTAYLVISMADKDDATQTVITLNATEN
jgi:hypothetical protein